MTLALKILAALAVYGTKRLWNLPWQPLRIATIYEEASLAICAATYAYHLTNAHAFIDSNKRVATAASLSFLQTNGFDIEVTDDELIALFLDIAASRLSRQQVEQFFTTRLKPYVEE